MCHLMAAWPPARIERAQGFIRWLVRPGSARFCQPYFLTPTRAVARSEQIEARGRRNPEAYAVYVEGFRRPRTKRCEAYRHGASTQQTGCTPRISSDRKAGMRSISP